MGQHAALLFYDLRLRCYVVVELMAGESRPEHAGKLNFYLTAVDETDRDKDKDGPTIGLMAVSSFQVVPVRRTLATRD